MSNNKELLSNDFVQRGERLSIDHELFTDGFRWESFSLGNFNIGIHMLKEFPSDKDSISSFPRSKQKLC